VLVGCVAEGISEEDLAEVDRAAKHGEKGRGLQGLSTRATSASR
jgi:hypothetical protein